jgi:hypothetical protein
MATRAAARDAKEQILLLAGREMGVPPGELDSLIFHELVHVVQYDLLGLNKFVELFVSGWVNQGFNYAAIPLEMDAYDLQNRFEADPEAPFQVKDEVSRSLEMMLDD